MLNALHTLGAVSAILLFKVISTIFCSDGGDYDT